MASSEPTKDQREETGPKSSFQLGPIDKDAVKNYKNKISADAERLDRQQQDSSYVASSTSDIFPQTSSSEETVDDSFEPGRMLKGHYSLLKVPRYSMELIRGDVSSNLGAC